MIFTIKFIKVYSLYLCGIIIFLLSYITSVRSVLVILPCTGVLVSCICSHLFSAVLKLLMYIYIN